MKKGIATVLITVVICGMGGGWWYSAHSPKTDNAQLRQWQEQIRVFRVFKEEQQLELDILKIQTEVGKLKVARTPTLTPEQLGGEFVPLDKLPPEVKAPKK